MPIADHCCLSLSLSAGTVPCTFPSLHVSILYATFQPDFPFSPFYLMCDHQRKDKTERKMTETLRGMLAKLFSEQKYISLDMEH